MAWWHPREAIPGETVAYLELAALPSAPFWARRQTQAVLRAWRLQSATIETAELLASELVTNAAKFSGSPAQKLRYSELVKAERISLTLRYSPGRLIIEVVDSDENPPVLAGTDLYAESGRGLMLVDAMSKEWSYFLLPSYGKLVYCVIEALAPTEPGADSE